MRFIKSLVIFKITLLVFFLCSSLAESITSGELKDKGKHIFWLKNDQINCSISFKNGKLISDRIDTQPKWISKFGTNTFAIITDADFGIDMMWTSWRAPGKINNADNPVTLTKDHFKMENHKINELSKGAKEMIFLFKGNIKGLQIKVTYKLRPGDFYIKRRIAIRDTEYSKHFLRKIASRRGFIKNQNVFVIKKGGFGQPIVFKHSSGGAFFGLEYPSSQNLSKIDFHRRLHISCSQMFGQKITRDWIKTEWVVQAVIPNNYIKHWFFKYIDDIRVAKLKPYTLYNSWYDLRAVDYPSKEPTKENNVMNEKNVFRMINLVRKNMIEKYGIKMDAFVLDDGWDVYESDWKLKKDQFPNGMKPIADELKKTGTNLGIWFGPTGGYSARNKRINWMRAHGYEVVGEVNQRHNAMLCLGGKKYSKLFKKRVVDFVEKDGVGFFKWDGIQYSCSEPDHGHPIGIYSRRAILESLIKKCFAVRKKKTKIFLNITSGTWLSPWWVKYANTIWMQGDDYGYSNVPSISQRDGAITYRDYILFDDFINKDLWFPIANLMTHGIIKGNLQKLGGEKEPIDKFTDNALLYFARGVTMWELYISPDLLTNQEWNAIAKSIHWAKDRFSILTSTEMIGGNPGEMFPYGYVHFKGKRGIIAARNPFISSKKLQVELSPKYGFDPHSHSIVLERIYPTKWISTELYSAGAKIEIPLEGYETAIYELYPLKEAQKPLFAGVTYDVSKESVDQYTLDMYNSEKNCRLLNPEKIKKIYYEGKEVPLSNLTINSEKQPEPIMNYSIKTKKKRRGMNISAEFRLHGSVKNALLAVLLRTDGKLKKKSNPDVKFLLDGKKVKVNVQKQKGIWAWHTINISAGKHNSRIQIKSFKELKEWTGTASIWLVYRQKQSVKQITFQMNQGSIQQRPMPPRPWPAGEIRKNKKLGEIKINLN